MSNRVLLPRKWCLMSLVIDELHEHDELHEPEYPEYLDEIDKIDELE